ncbi:hypothetical protein [Ralstonia solanacearum]|uniref:Transmembrane protein n=1 Tax=Ralstonia solanacearum TaxID=305 RepID=A0AAE3T6I9_RALSL|nr:hypothetical protein [Ralstonia solanacearum]MBB6580363.1 hypothetical protein [Ralstonia solanacearum]MDB0524008.1 hypothetical protein [Ralstonia solanacearum]
MSYWARIRQFLGAVQDVAPKNLPTILLSAALAFGGLPLLAYAWSINQLPDFTWNDLTGTLLAVCTTGTLVVTLIVAYCLSAGYFGRIALESVYPEAANHIPAKSEGPDMPGAPYVQLIRGPFILGVTCFSTLTWVGLFLSMSSEQLVSPHDERLFGALFVALFAVAVLVLFDWRRFRRQWVRHGLFSLLCGAIATFVTIITAWSVGAGSLVTKRQENVSDQAAAIDWTSVWTAALNHALWIGMVAIMGTVALINLGVITSSVGRGVRGISRQISWRPPACLMAAMTRAFHILVGEASDRKLVRAKMWIALWFCIFSSAVFFTAGNMASIGNAHDWGRNFIFVSTMLTVLNWISFSVRKWEERASLGLIAAAMIFAICPLVTQNPIMLPKMIVSMLGLGNERLASIGLSSKQCAALAPYGVNCVPDNELAVTLVNVNLLSRLGGSMVLELLIKDGALDAEGSHAATLSTPPSSDGDAPPVIRTLVATQQMGPKSSAAEKCDKLLVSQLQSNDTINAKSLRCVVLVVPKDQVLGYTKANRRTYRGEYSAYEPSPTKAPAVVKVISGESNVTGQMAALLAEPVAR